MIKQITDTRHQKWIAVESTAVHCTLAAVMMVLLAVALFIQADRNGAPEIMVTMTMASIIGTAIALLIAGFLMVVATVIRRRVQAQISTEK